MEYLKRYLGLGYRRSLNRHYYRSVARLQGLSPLTVYKLAHGRRPRTARQVEARRELKKSGMIHH